MGELLTGQIGVLHVNPAFKSVDRCSFSLEIWCLQSVQSDRRWLVHSFIHYCVMTFCLFFRQLWSPRNTVWLEMRLLFLVLQKKYPFLEWNIFYVFFSKRISLFLLGIKYILEILISLRTPWINFKTSTMETKS